MDKLHRYQQLLGLLRARRLPVKMADLAQEMECDNATVKRVVSEMRDYFGAPILSSRNGYQLDRQQMDSFELPGVWFNSAELVALLTMQEVLANVRAGVLSDAFAELRTHVDKLMADRHIGSAVLAKKIRALLHGVRGKEVSAFAPVADALAQQKQLTFDYDRRDRKALEKRHVSPQRLIYYRGNLYLQAWCHERTALRTFALERMQNAALYAQSAQLIDDNQLDASLGSGYGIFAGPATDTARLRFSASAAQWVCDELWHPEQILQWQADGSLELHVPYGNPTELIMDILRHGADCEVIAPTSLRNAVISRVERMQAQYRG